MDKTTMIPKEEVNKMLDEALKELNCGFFPMIFKNFNLLLHIITLILIGILIGMILGIAKMQLLIKTIKAEAVSKGHAEWVIDNDTGTTTFKFKERK